MNLVGTAPETPHAPKWAVARGLPAPEEGEGFFQYCERIGIEEAEVFSFVEGLDERTAEIANARLGTHIVRTMPGMFRHAIASRIGYK
jgi:hypothetical protein